MNEGLAARKGDRLDADLARLGEPSLADLFVHEDRFGGPATHLAREVAILAERDVHADERAEEDVFPARRTLLAFERFLSAHRVRDLGPARAFSFHTATCFAVTNAVSTFAVSTSEHAARQPGQRAVSASTLSCFWIGECQISGMRSL